MKDYIQLLSELAYVAQVSPPRPDRTGTGTHSVFGRQLRFDISQSFPLLTHRRLHWKSIVHELLWFLRGETNVAYLRANGVSIWDEWAADDGSLGPVYGKQWRAWADTTDQIVAVVESIRKDPLSRRHIVSAWNVADLPRMALAPCHVLFQFYVDDDREGLRCQLYQRSADAYLGLPFNIASYALLTYMIAHVTGLHARELVISIGDAHLYANHVEQAREVLRRDAGATELPVLGFATMGAREIDDFDFDKINLSGYHPLPALSAPVAI